MTIQGLLKKLGGGAAVLVALALVALAAPAPASAALGLLRTERAETANDLFPVRGDFDSLNEAMGVALYYIEGEA